MTTTSVDSPAKKAFPTKEFKVELIRHDLSQTEVAKHLGVSRVLVTQVVNNLRTATRVRKMLERLYSDLINSTYKSLQDYKLKHNGV